MDPLVFGHLSDERIVSAVPLNDQIIRLYIRADGKVLHRDAEFFPFFFLSDPRLLEGYKSRHWLKELSGTNAFSHIAAFTRWSEMWDAVQHVIRRHNELHPARAQTWQDVPGLFLRPDPIRQYLAQSGSVLFREMPFTDIVRLQLEVISKPRSAPRAGDPGIAVIAATTTDGHEFLLTTGDISEQELLEQFAAWVRERDPDVIEGHALNDRILPALFARSEATAANPSLGREGRPLRQQTMPGWFASGESERIQYECFGRHLIDTVQLAEAHFNATLNPEPVSLGSIERALGHGESAPPPSIEDLWKLHGRDAEQALAGTLRRLRGVRRATDGLLPVLVAQARMCPLTLEYLAQASISARIESLMLREYIRRKHSIPRVTTGSPTAPPVAEAFRTGAFAGGLALDSRILSGTIIHRESLSPEADQLAVYPQLAGTLLQQATGADDNAKGARVLLSGLYPYVASARAMFQDETLAALLSRHMLTYLAELRVQLERHNAIALHADEQRVWFIPPDNVAGTANEETFVERVFRQLEPALPLASRFEAFLVQHRRSYAYLNERSELRLIQTGLVPRGSERFIRRFLLRCIECLLTRDIPRLHHTYATFHTMIAKHQWSVVDFCRQETVREEMEKYIRDLGSGARTPAPGMEAARRAQVYVKPGTHVLYYISGTQHDVRVSEASRVAEEWDENFPNENSAYYLQRLKDAAERLRGFFEPGDFELIFSLDDLFGFSENGVKIVERTLTEEGEGEAGETGGGEEFGIWLAEDDGSKFP